MRKTILSALALLLPLAASAQTYPYQNPNLTAHERAVDLCSRLTLEEKASLMLDDSPAIPRLGISSGGAKPCTVWPTWAMSPISLNP